MLNVAVKERLEKYMKEAGVSQAKIAATDWREYDSSFAV